MQLETCYLTELLHAPYLKKILARAKKCLLKSNLSFDAVAFKGMSGAILGPNIAMKFKKHMIMVRSPGSSCHSKFPVEGYDKAKNYIIVDDFIESGDTVCQIILAIENFAPQAKCLGILIVSDYDNSEFLPLNSFKKLAKKSWKRHFGKARTN